MLESLRLLHTDYFDIYQLHGLASLEEVETAFGPGGVMELLVEMKEKGIARKLGITAHSEAAALRALQLYDFDTVLFPFNWHMHMAHGMGESLRKAAKSKGIGLMCIKSMIERSWEQEERLASRYPKSWCKPFDTKEETKILLSAIRYSLSLGVDLIVPPGNFDHFRFAVEHIDEALSQPLSEDERKILTERLALVKDRPFIEPEEVS